MPRGLVPASWRVIKSVCPDADIAVALAAKVDRQRARFKGGRYFDWRALNEFHRISANIDCLGFAIARPAVKGANGIGHGLATIANTVPSEPPTR